MWLLFSEDVRVPGSQENISPASASRSKDQWDCFPWERQKKERKEGRGKWKRLSGSPRAPGLRKQILCTLPSTLSVCIELLPVRLPIQMGSWVRQKGSIALKNGEVRKANRSWRGCGVGKRQEGGADYREVGDTAKVYGRREWKAPAREDRQQ